MTCFLFYLQTYRTHQASPQQAAGTENNGFQLAEHFLPLHHLRSGTAPGPQQCVCLWLVPTTGSSTLKLRRQTLRSPELPEDAEVPLTWEGHHVLRRVKVSLNKPSHAAAERRKMLLFQGVDTELGRKEERSFFKTGFQNHLGPKVLIWKLTGYVRTETTSPFLTRGWKVEITPFATSSQLASLHPSHFHSSAALTERTHTLPFLPCYTEYLFFGPF